MPSPVSHQQLPSFMQSITVAPEEKKKDPPKGAFLFNDSYHALQVFEGLAVVAWGSPLAYLAGLVLGTVKAGYQWRTQKAPEKLDYDSEMQDFGAAVYSRSLYSVSSIVAKRLASSAFLAHFETFTKLITASQFPVLRALGSSCTMAGAIQHGFVLYKATQLSEELVLRFAKWWDIPPK